MLLTCGSRGSFFQDEAGLHHAKAMSVRVVDTCGAGDSFIAAFTTAFCIEGLEPDRALQMPPLRVGKPAPIKAGFRKGCAALFQSGCSANAPMSLPSAGLGQVGHNSRPAPRGCSL